MESVSILLNRLVALCVMSAVSELMLPGGRLKQGVRLIAGLLTAEAILRMVLAIPAALGMGW